MTCRNRVAREVFAPGPLRGPLPAAKRKRAAKPSKSKPARKRAAKKAKRR